MTQYKFGDIVLVDFPFSDQTGTKRRPALVIQYDFDDDVLLARITSKPKESISDIQIGDWKGSKLLFPSTIRMGKLAAISATLIERKIGDLPVTDKAEVLAALDRLIVSLKEKF